jgi:hypothetical protein
MQNFDPTFKSVQKSLASQKTLVYYRNKNYSMSNYMEGLQHDKQGMVR